MSDVPFESLYDADNPAAESTCGVPRAHGRMANNYDIPKRRGIPPDIEAALDKGGESVLRMQRQHQMAQLFRATDQMAALRNIDEEILILGNEAIAFAREGVRRAAEIKSPKTRERMMARSMDVARKASDLLRSHFEPAKNITVQTHAAPAPAKTVVADTEPNDPDDEAFMPDPGFLNTMINGGGDAEAD